MKIISESKTILFRFCKKCKACSCIGRLLMKNSDFSNKLQTQIRKSWTIAQAEYYDHFCFVTIPVYIREHAEGFASGYMEQSRSDRPAGTSGYLGSIQPRENETNGGIRSATRSELQRTRDKPDERRRRVLAHEAPVSVILVGNTCRDKYNDGHTRTRKIPRHKEPSSKSGSH